MMNELNAETVNVVRKQEFEKASNYREQKGGLQYE